MTNCSSCPRVLTSVLCCCRPQLEAKQEARCREIETYINSKKNEEMMSCELCASSSFIEVLEEEYFNIKEDDMDEQL